MTGPSKNYTLVRSLTGSSSSVTESGRNVAIKYRIVYTDGRQQEVTAESHGVYGAFIIFSHDDRNVLSVATANVESVAESSVPEAQ